mmetsp:Transcript_27557/g.95274  ORF Transcript_27557/g.95274 Transcript_27557/m.95274 type:complete len:261 (+) Transcript_27557:1774-2556(+)
MAGFGMVSSGRPPRAGWTHRSTTGVKYERLTCRLTISTVSSSPRTAMAFTVATAQSTRRQAASVTALAAPVLLPRAASKRRRISRRTALPPLARPHLRRPRRMTASWVASGQKPPQEGPAGRRLARRMRLLRLLPRPRLGRIGTPAARRLRKDTLLMARTLALSTVAPSTEAESTLATTARAVSTLLGVSIKLLVSTRRVGSIPVTTAPVVNTPDTTMSRHTGPLRRRRSTRKKAGRQTCQARTCTFVLWQTTPRRMTTS